MSGPSIALWATNVSRRFNGLDGWLADVKAKLTEAKAAGAEMLIAPEYWCEQWLTFKPAGLKSDQEIAWMASLSQQALDGLKQAVADTDTALVAGTMPWGQDDGSFTNRSWMLLPDGRTVAQDKLTLTPSEKDEQNWCLSPGQQLAITEWRGYKLATLICLDIEVPALSVALADHAPDLIIVPSMTELPSGYHRVFGCAKARAVELMTTVAVCGCVGDALGSDYIETNYSGAAVFVPCEKELGYTGINAQIEPLGEAQGDGPLLVTRDLPFDLIRQKREGGAEVWPGGVKRKDLQIVT